MTRDPLLWVIDPSTHVAEDQGVRSILDRWPGRSRLIQPGLRPAELLSPAAGYDPDGIVLMGSGASVYDSLPWITPLADWLAPILNGGVDLPLLGICFGHQMIAHAAGATIGSWGEGGEKLVGVETSELLDSRLLPGQSRLRVIVSHREEVKSCPSDFRVCARRRDVAIDGLEHEGLPIFSFQFHPEAGSEFAERAGIDPARLDPAVARDSQRLFSAFLDLVLTHHQKKRADGLSVGSKQAADEGDYRRPA